MSDLPATVGGRLGALPVWQARLATMAACSVPGVLLRLSGVHLPPVIGLLVFGGAVMAAAFMLAWAAEAAEIDLAPGIAVAGVAFVAVLPEYVIEIYFAFSGQGRVRHGEPHGQHATAAQLRRRDAGDRVGGAGPSRRDGGSSSWTSGRSGASTSRSSPPRPCTRP